MIFKPKDEKVKLWDTWLYCENNKYYLYYLASEGGAWDGFGVAVSDDGVHFEDKGYAVKTSDKMIYFFGTGAVWKSPQFEKDGLYYCNYSEWRKEESTGNATQNIFFVKSRDLIHWEKLGEEKMYSADQRWYDKYGRWDCIYPLKKEGGYYGYFTATPKQSIGFGMAETEDGVNWKTLPPPAIEWGKTPPLKMIEAGAVEKIGDRFFSAIGCYPGGIYSFYAFNERGPFYPCEKNYGLVTNKTFVNSYFARFFVKDGEVFANFHSLLREESEHPTGYLSPLKRAVNEDGTLYFKWFENNEKLKGEPVESGEKIFAEGKLGENFTIEITLKKGFATLKMDKKGNGGIYYDGEEESADDFIRNIEINPNSNFKLLLSETLAELYVDDYFMFSHTLKERVRKVNKGKSYRLKTD